MTQTIQYPNPAQTTALFGTEILHSCKKGYMTREEIQTEMTVLTAIPIALLTTSVEGVGNVLRMLNLQKYIGVFQAHATNGAMLALMDIDALKDLGISSSLDRIKILAWVERRKLYATLNDFEEL